MRVRCTATADYRANGVGSLELETTDLGLVVTYLSVAAYRDGYAPGPATEGTQVRVPWAGVRATRADERRLLLSLPEAATPLNRFALSSFAKADALAPPELRRRRRIVRLFSAGAMLLTLVGLWALLPDAAPHFGARLALAIAGTAALSILLVGVAADQWLASRNPPPRDVLDELWGELSLRQSGGVPSDMLESDAPQITLEKLQRLLPRSAVGIAITLAATSLAALITTARLGGTPRTAAHALAPERRATPPRAPATEPSPDPDDGRRPEPPPVAAPPPGASPSPVPDDGRPHAVLGESCRCTRHASPLWRELPARVSPLLISRRERPHAGHRHVDLELAIVNNGDQTLRDLHVSVMFSAKGRRKPLERPLYFAGPLLPGRAIKWHVEGRGDAFEILAPDLGTLEPDGADAAPADAFVELTHANHRPVRLHAAMMLAFLGDPRARVASVELREAMRDEEMPYLDRVAHATADVVACSLRVTASANESADVEGCLHNVSNHPRRVAEVTLRGLQANVDARSPVAPPPFVVWERHSDVGHALAAGDGRRFQVSDLGELSGAADHEVVVISERATTSTSEVENR